MFLVPHYSGRVEKRQAPVGHSGTPLMQPNGFMGCESQLVIQNQVNHQSDKFRQKHFDIPTNQIFNELGHLGLIWVPLDQMSH